MSEGCNCQAVGYEDGVTYQQALHMTADEVESAEDVLSAIMWETVDPVEAATAWLTAHAPGMVDDPQRMAAAKQKAREGAARVGKPYAECLNWVTV